MGRFLLSLRLFLCLSPTVVLGFSPSRTSFGLKRSLRRWGWVKLEGGEWEWQEEDPGYRVPAYPGLEKEEEEEEDHPPKATPKLPSGSFHPKQSLGQNYINDGNTVHKILRAFHDDATKDGREIHNIIEMGPGAGALTDALVKIYGVECLECIELDTRAIDLLNGKHPQLKVHHDDVLQVNYPAMAREQGRPLVVVGNLPFYITSQILFCLADASHVGAIDCATVTMQWEVADRMVAPTNCKDYGILSVVFQTYANVKRHFKIRNTVFYPKPKVDSALVGLHFLRPEQLRRRLAGVDPVDFRRVVTTAFRQRRKTMRKNLRHLVLHDICDGDKERAAAIFNTAAPTLPKSVQEAAKAGDLYCKKQRLCKDWASQRPENLTPGQFIELTRLLYGPAEGIAQEGEEESELGGKVWRKGKHGDEWKSEDKVVEVHEEQTEEDDEEEDEEDFEDEDFKDLEDLTDEDLADLADEDLEGLTDEDLAGLIDEDFEDLDDEDLADLTDEDLEGLTDEDFGDFADLEDEDFDEDEVFARATATRSSKNVLTREDQF